MKHDLTIRRTKTDTAADEGPYVVACACGWHHAGSYAEITEAAHEHMNSSQTPECDE